MKAGGRLKPKIKTKIFNLIKKYRNNNTEVYTVS